MCPRLVRTGRGLEVAGSAGMGTNLLWRRFLWRENGCVGAEGLLPESWAAVARCWVRKEKIKR